ncbi:MAG: sensor domain-containing diguanylate cyclase, partial [Spirochaetes bacterium]|nr:sensor domain-containing diguanylate cyclase [Spirochaetota bacterium]
ELAKSCFEYGNFLHSFGRESEARVNWQKAIDLFTEIEAKQYMKRTAKVLGITDKLSGDIEESMQERLKVERRMTTVLDTSRYLSSILDLDELLERIMDKTIEMVGAERGILFLYPEGTRGEKGNLAVKVVRNVDKNEIESAAFGTSLSIISRIEEEKKSLIIEDAGTDISLKEQASVVKFGLKSILCTPIMARGEMLGVIYLDNHLVTGLFKERDLWVLDLISNQAGVSIENALLYKRAVTDGLTGLYNRIFFDNYLINSVNEALRYKKNLSLIIIDIDHFKEFNDNYGHQTGDEVIKRVSSSLLKNVRTSDIAARYGGDEFVVILPETDTKGGKIAAEKIREAVLKNKIMFKKKGKEKELTITLSMGVASLARDDDRLGLISKADKALYISKEKGRNRVEVFKG